MKNKIEDLRNHLFETLESLKDPDKPMELDRARAIADVGRVLIESAKAEVSYLQVTNQTRGSGFIPDAEVGPQRPRLAAGAARP